MPSVKELKKRYYENYRSPFLRFNDEVQKYVGGGFQVLHVGCGADDSLGLRTRARLTIGIDLDEWILQNSDIDIGVVGNIYQLPLETDSVDMVISRWVLEHLDRPDVSFREVFRVLRKGGYFLVLTPNQWHYSGFITSVIPHRAQKWFVQYLLKGNPAEVYPTHYRANSLRRLRLLAEQSGLRVERFELVESAPALLGFSPLTYLAGVAYERTVNKFSWLSGFRSAILGIFCKS